MFIRLANKNDILKVSRLWISMVDELGPDLEPNVEWWRMHANNFLDSGDYFLYVAEIGGKIVGFIDYFMFCEPATSEIHCIGQHFFVLLEYRKGSVAGKLYKTAIKESKKKGAQRWELFCFPSEIKMWEKHRFELKRCLMRK